MGIFCWRKPRGGRAGTSGAGSKWRRASVDRPEQAGWTLDCSKFSLDQGGHSSMAPWAPGLQGSRAPGFQGSRAPGLHGSMACLPIELMRITAGLRAGLCVRRILMTPSPPSCAGALAVVQRCRRCKRCKRCKRCSTSSVADRMVEGSAPKRQMRRASVLIEAKTQVHETEPPAGHPG